jgi:hypothetical protein
VDGILTTLKPAGRADLSTAQRLPANQGRAFIGVYPRPMEFSMSIDQGEALLASAGDVDYAKVVRKFLVAEDLADSPTQSPARYIVDFAQMPLEEAMDYPLALEHVRKHVRPLREHDDAQMKLWWQHWRPRPKMRAALAGMTRMLTVPRVSKHIEFVWQSTEVCAGDATVVFAFDDDYAMGVLDSATHEAWARGLSSTFKADIRYTPSTVFETFPWPTGVPDDLRERIADASRRLIARRSEICTEREIGLTTLYNQVDDGAWRDLAALHDELDKLVAEAYGWPASIAQDGEETNRRLLELNQKIAGGEMPYAPFSE